MTNLLWQKPGVAVDAKIQSFLAGDDVILDREFFLYDIAASKAHAQGLQHIGILSLQELGGLSEQLDLLAADFRSGAFVLDAQYEDCHSAIEARLTERLGDAGRKIHTGRSRNDQILVATRLWLKDKLQRVATLSAEIAKVALD
ncbi:lyase family protein, partial [Xanthomonas perforans]